MSRDGKYAELTGIIGAFYEVYNRLGYGFLERVYENALEVELRHRGLEVERQKAVVVYYRGRVVGDYLVDMVVADRVVLELKAARHIMEEHEAQLLNYLNATSCQVDLLLNFGPKPGVRRRVYDNERKPNLKQS